MASTRTNSSKVASILMELFRKLPPSMRLPALVLLAIGVVIWLLVFQPNGTQSTSDTGISSPSSPSSTSAIPPSASGGYLFCFWNVENLFDDRNDNRREIDEVYDDPFAENAALREEKLDHIASALLKMNEGRGPDIITCAELESIRSAELLMQTLNAKLKLSGADSRLQYTQISMKNLNGGRHIATGIITRLPVTHQLTRQHGDMLRILETHLNVDGHDLCIISSHWTSKVPQRDGSNGESGRRHYAREISNVYNASTRKNPDVDFLVCGDFNDTPDSPSVVEGLRAVGDRTRVVPRAGNANLLNLLAGKNPQEFGTIMYNRTPYIYDQICISPGLLDSNGWSCDPASVRVISDGLLQAGLRRREPWRFDKPANPPTGGRGYSDHLPVTVRLKVQ